jgi:uncharacterized Zn finger protein (UPF0148 family)
MSDIRDCNHGHLFLLTPKPCPICGLQQELAEAKAKLAEYERTEPIKRKELHDAHAVLSERIDAINIPCVHALEAIWSDLLLKSKPGYGPWEYPMQAARHIIAEFNELKAELDDYRAALAGISTETNCMGPGCPYCEDGNVHSPSHAAAIAIDVLEKWKAKDKANNTLSAEFANWIKDSPIASDVMEKRKAKELADAKAKLAKADDSIMVIAFGVR